MENIFANIKDRVLEIAATKGISKEKFFSDLGFTYGNFKGKAKEKALSSDSLAKIVSNYPDINPEWLLTGKGEMLKENITQTVAPVPVRAGQEQKIIELQEQLLKKWESEKKLEYENNVLIKENIRLQKTVENFKKELQSANTRGNIAEHGHLQELEKY